MTTIRAPYFPAGAAEPGPEQEWESSASDPSPGAEPYYDQGADTRPENWGEFETEREAEPG